MEEFLFKRIDTYYLTIRSDSIEEAQKMAEATPIWHDDVHTVDGNWELDKKLDTK